MKQLIILCSTIVLGIALYSMIAGPDEDSVLGTVKGVWEQEIDLQKKYP